MDNDNEKLEEDLDKDKKDVINNLGDEQKQSNSNFKNVKTNNISSFPASIPIKENNPQAAAEKIEEKKNLDKKLWVPDEDVQNCYNCGSKFFSLFNRKHHCRICGNIFCKNCIETIIERQEIKACAYCIEKRRELKKILKNNLVERNGMFKIKTFDYVKNKKKNMENIDNFCGFNKYESKLLKEFHDNLNKNYETLLQKMIYQVLNEKIDKLKYPSMAEDWGNIIYDLIKQVINNLSPTFLNLNDTININDYLKIKTLEYKNQDKCKVIDGYALRKNVGIKSMRTSIENPKILLIKGNLEGVRTNPGKNNQNNNIIVKSTAIEAYIEILRKKIEEISPQIILVEGNASQKFQAFFATNKTNISIVDKVNIKKLNRIARCVQTIVIPSPDLIGKSIILGSCKKFEIENIKTNLFVENKNNKPQLKQGEYHLMKFEGCGEILFNTIILSGPNKDELKELKKLMKIIARTARFLYCQKFLLKYFNMLYEPPITGEEKNKNKPLKKKNSIFKKINYSLGFDTDIIDEKNNEFDCIFMSLTNKNKNDISYNSSFRISTINSDTDRTSISTNTLNAMFLKESQVLKSTPNQCFSCSYTMNAYSIADDEEKTLGQNIISFLEESKERCEKCGDMKLNHTSFIYKNNGRIKITVYNLNEQNNYIDQIAEYLGFTENPSNPNIKKELVDNGIYSYGFCEICNHVVTPLIKLPEEILNFSATKFYQNILYNKNMINFGDEKVNILNVKLQNDLFDLNSNINYPYKCRKLNHLHYRDISRIFITRNGVVKFIYEEIIKYKLLGSQLNTNYEWDIEKNKDRKIKEIEYDQKLTSNVLKSLKSNFSFHQEFLESLGGGGYGDLRGRILKVIIEAFAIIEELQKKGEQIFKDKNEYENIFLYNHDLKKYLLRIMNIKILSNKLFKEVKRIAKLVFFEEVDDINKKEEGKAVELLPKEDNNSINLNNKSLSDNIKTNKNTEPIIKEKNSVPEALSELQKKEKNKPDLNLKTKALSSPLINNNNNNNNSSENKLNLSNSSSISSVEEDEDENNKGEQNLTLNIESTDDIKEKTNLKINDENSIKLEGLEKKEDLSLKKSIFSFFSGNPELKEKLNNKHNVCLNIINEYANKILDLDKKEKMKEIITKLNYYDKNHSTFSSEVNEEDVCSIITYALTSDQYLDAVKIDNKNGLNEIQSEFNNNELENDADNDLFCDTSLLYDIDKVKFTLGNLSSEKISQTLKNELISNDNKKCIYEVKYNPSQVFNQVFEKKAKKQNKSNTSSKINYQEFNQKLFSMNAELKNLKNEIKKIINEKYDEIKRRFVFPKTESFEEDKLPITELKVTIYYTRHFEAFRILYGSPYIDFLYSIIKSQEWSSVSGGKSKAHFFKSWNEKFVVKCLSELEFNMFINSCFHYFVHNNKYFFFKMPSSLVKVVGAYRIKITTNKKNVLFCVIMENLNYLLGSKNASMITYDLKGSEINRYIKTKEPGKVLMDTNFVEDFKGEPLPLDQKIYTLFLCAISNDTKICRNMEVIDYSLLCIMIDYKEDENDKEENINKPYLKKVYDRGDNEGKVQFIRLGVLDYFRKYTSDKQLETFVKTILNKFNDPTVVNPKKYDERFFKKLSNYFIGI